MIANFFSKTKPVNTLAIVTLLLLIYTLSSIVNFDEVLSISFFFKEDLIFFTPLGGSFYGQFYHT